MKIYDLIPDVEVLLNLAPEELAYSLLRVADANIQNGIVHRETVISIDPIPGNDRPYPNHRSAVEIAMIEALHWLEINALLLPAPGTNGNNGWRVFGRRGKELLSQEKFNTFRKAASFQKSILHSAIADRTWIALARGELSDAVFIAFRAVEEAVRAAGKFSPTDIGTELMRKAFNPENGPLTDTTQPVAEREALAHLFAGAIGSYKNPHSHRTVTINDQTEAQEMVMLASHLLRIVDSRS